MKLRTSKSADPRLLPPSLEGREISSIDSFSLDDRLWLSNLRFSDPARPRLFSRDIRRSDVPTAVTVMFDLSDSLRACATGESRISDAVGVGDTTRSLLRENDLLRRGRCAFVSCSI